MAQLKAVVFSLRNVFFDEDLKRIDEVQIAKLINLILHLSKKGIRVILHSNDRWSYTANDERTIADVLSERTGQTVK